MFAGLSLRLLAAITGDWTMKPDELFQYLEQAHRIVFGYGQIPWEFRFGERTWLLPMLSVPPLWLCKVLGFDSPEQYAPVVRSFHAAFSMLIPIGMYFFTRRVHSETAARFALVLGCFWHELVIIAPHPVAEASSSAFVFAALAVIMAAKMTTQRVAICGFLLGMAFVLRVQYAPTIGLIGLALLFYADNRGRITLIVAGLLAILIAGLVDYFYWGGFLQTYINYAKVQFSGYTQHTYNASGDFHLHNLFIGSAGLHYVIAGAALFYYRRLWVFIILMLSVQLIHNLVTTKEYVNTFLAIPFLLLMAAGVMAEWKTLRLPDNTIIGRKSKAVTLLLLCFISVTISGLGAYLPKQQKLYVFSNNKVLFHQDSLYAVNLALSKVSAEKMKAVVWLAPRTDAHDFGGYYYMHHDVPMYFPLSSDYDRKLLLSEPPPKNDETRNLQDNAMLAQAGTVFAESASHLVLPVGLATEGFELLTITGGLGIHVNNNPQQVTIIPGATYDILENNILEALGDLHKLDVVDSDNYPLTYNRGASPSDR